LLIKKGFSLKESSPEKAALHRCADRAEKIGLVRFVIFVDLANARKSSNSSESSRRTLKLAAPKTLSRFLVRSMCYSASTTLPGEASDEVLLKERANLELYQLFNGTFIPN
jgi:hypothetical protein